jgi:hypothetical protein
VSFGRSIQWGARLLLLVAAFSSVSNAWADHRHSHGGVRYGVGVVVAPRWDPWFWGPPYPYPYPSYPPVIIERSPPVYIEQPQAIPEPAQAAYWYYCAESNNYYPYVQRCPAGWRRIEPQPGDLR